MISLAGDKKQGYIFHIIHGSFVDGHGIRTTVFLKGCPLRCLWCCNPEGQGGQPEIKYTSSLCNGCGKCVDICPVDAIQKGSSLLDDVVTLDRETCTVCGKCIDVCFTGALEYFGYVMTVAELFDILKKDEQYYRDSGGGVTIGGGEPTFQHEFTNALINKCHENYIHVAVDTCGYTYDPEGFRCLENADLLLYDIKGMNLAEHIRNTGVSNEIILSNLKKLADMEKAIIIRMPLLPGYNDSNDNILQTAELLSKMKSVERIDLLPYHKYGMIKYEQLGMQCKLFDLQTASEEHVEEIKHTFECYGLNVQIGG